MAHREFSYQSLVKPTDIRVLRLQPGAGEEPVKCTLIHYSLETRDPPYTALSYTWGDLNDRRDILCNGKLISVTANLHSSLRRIRLRDKDYLLWVDAICINQSDISEREAQVRIMRNIYEQASEVIADVGDWAEDPGLAFQLASDVIGVVRDLDDSVIVMESHFERYGLPPSHHQAWKAWTAFLGRPWFTRVWVIQEFALPSNVRMLCGETFFPCTALYHTIVQMIQHGMGENQRSAHDGYMQRMASSRSCLGIMNMSIARQAIEQHAPQTLLKLLESSRSCEASDDRDKIYALLGLSADAADLSLDINYSESSSQVFQRVARRLLLAEGGVETLYGAGGSRKLQDLPSWTPDWSCRKAASHLGGLRDSNQHLIYHASRDSSFNVHFIEDSKCLVVVGCVVDEIRVLGGAFFWDTHDSSIDDLVIWDKLRAWETEARGLVNHITSYPGAHSVYDAYWRTCIGNKTHLEAEAEAPAEYAESFAALLKIQKIYQETAPISQHKTPFFASNLTSETEAKEFARLEIKSRPYRLSQQVMLWGRRFCVTSKGYFGMVTENTLAGDSICIVMGSAVPFIVRKTEVPQSSSSNYSLQGECYIHGIMNGEALDAEDFKVKDINLQ